MLSVCGIDPGVTGAVCCLTDKILFADTPVLQIKSGKSIKNVLDAHRAAAILKEFNPDYVIIEKVQAMPGGGERTMGATSAFSFGKGVGIWLGILAALQIPYEEVHPATWKKRLMGGMAKEKDASRMRAMQIYPHSAEDLKLKKHHGRADALLLAHYHLVVGEVVPELPKRKK
jgi:crossover junction endodeoxyribonuclease RuvC